MSRLGLGLLGVAPVRISRRVPRGVGEISGGEVAGVSSRSWVDNGRRGGAGGGESGGRHNGAAAQEAEPRGKEKGDRLHNHLNMRPDAP
jgi:hypothetical protein